MLPNRKLMHHMFEKKHIRSIDAQRLRQLHELMTLKKLQHRKQSYLNDYDQLFRYVTLWLLQQGYDLTQHEPHQVLKSICLFHCPDVDIQGFIQHRHQLKKGLLQNAESTYWKDLRLCLEDLKTRLQAYDLAV